jgi:DMSO/TMAO reductase YedYZ molybdopterin-dependent catalytic subunit
VAGGGRKNYGKRLAKLHAWNGWMILCLSLSGLLLLSGYWRGVLGEGRVWLKWLHIAVGVAMLLPVFHYLLLASKHWKQLSGRPWQRMNVITVLALFLGWFVSGLILWMHKAAGPTASNAALLSHDLLTWIGLPYIIYHSIARTRWLKEPHRRAVKTGSDRESLHPASPQPIYTRRAFLKAMVGAGLAMTLGPSFLRWLGDSLGGMGTARSLEQLVQQDANILIPKPEPLATSSPPIGGGARGNFRIYTVAPIPQFTNENWSFSIDGLVERTLYWDWTQFAEMSRRVQVSDFHCVTGWSVYDNTWEGIPLRELLELSGVMSNASYVKFYSGDGVYTDSLSLEQARMDDVMVAVMHDGRPIPSDLGGPVRLIVPKMYAYKSVKWLNRIELIDEEHIGYWELRGYSKDAWV